MGRSRSRKQQRRWSGRAAAVFEAPVDREALFREAFQEVTAVLRGENTCGGCREFLENGVEGRGECLHPGSGILLPWTDTTACQFYAARR